MNNTLPVPQTYRNRESGERYATPVADQAEVAKRGGYSIPRWITRKYLSARVPLGARDDTAFKLAAALEWAHVGYTARERAAEELVALMDQPERDGYTVARVLEKVGRLAGAERTYAPRAFGAERTYAPRASVTDKFEAKTVPFQLPVFRSGDPQRLKWGWENHIAVMPVGKNSKGALPKWKGLQTAPPTDDDWAAWGSRAAWRNGNTGLLLGSEAPGMLKLYDIEVEHAKDFDQHPDRDYFLEHTPVVMSRKSAHLIIMSEEVTPSTKSHDEQGNLDGRFEFRGRGNYSLAPGSIHPASTPENPIVYQQLNPLCDTILRVSNVQAFVHHYFPGLFAPSKPAPIIEESESPGETIDEARMRWKGKERKAAVSAARDAVSNAVQSEPSFYDIDSKNPQKVPSLLRYFLGIQVQADTWSLPRGRLISLARLVCSRDTFMERENPTIAGLLGCSNWNTGHCDLHGDRCRCRFTCKSSWCSLCGSKVSERLASGFYPDLPVGRRVMSFTHLLSPEPGQDILSWAEGDCEEASKQSLDAFHALCRKITGRKGWEGREAIRASNYLLGDGWVLWRHTFAIEEQEVGEAQKLIKEFAKLGLHLEMQTLIPDGETWAKQLIELTTHGLRGSVCMDDRLESAEFVSIVQATRRRHLNQTYGALNTIEQSAPAPQPATCDAPSEDPDRAAVGEICGRKLRWRSDPLNEIPSEHVHKGVMVYCKAHRRLCALCRCGDHTA